MTYDQRVEMFKNLIVDEDEKDINDDCIDAFFDCAKGIIFGIKYPYKKEYPSDVDIVDHITQVQIALELYSKAGAEGEIQHSEGNISRTYSSANVSLDLLSKITPKCGVL